SGVGIQVHHHQDHVAAVGGTLGVAEQGRVVRPVEAEAAKLLQENGAFGRYADGSLVSRALSHVRMPEGWGVSGVFTRQDRRGRGYASSVVSALAEAAFRETDSVMLFVRSDNAAAKRAYQKVGFSTVANRVFCDVGVGWSP
ncbi:MAG: GNAT family N-acetyltransferase, partial [Nitrososphaerota archaeon]|nr:GNAT family N-acetyltransferase [Nitrososphaerota archaeon]